MQAIGIVVIEPGRLLRDGIRAILRDGPFAAVAAAGTAAEAFEAADGVTPDVVIWGFGAGEAETEAEMAWVRERCPGSSRPRFVLLADLAETTRLRRAVASGVDAILSHDISGEVLRRSLDLVVLGQQLFPAALVHPPAEGAAVSEAAHPAAHQADLIPFPTPPAPVAAPAPGAEAERARDVVLSEREGQILRHLVAGAANKAIARELRLTETTVKAHVKGLLRKIRASNRTQAAIWALNNNVQVSRAVGQVTSLPSAGAPGRRAAG